MQYSLRDPTLLSLLVHRETWPSSSRVWKELTRAAPLPVWSVLAELAGAVLAGASAVLVGTDAVLMICVILKVPVLAGAAVVFSGAEVFGAGFFGAAGEACPREADAGSVWTSGISGLFPLSMPALLSPTLAFLAVLAPLALAPVSEHLVEPPCPCRHWGQRSCSGGGLSFTGVAVFLGAGEDAHAGEVAWLVARISGRVGDAGLST
jgi:hypothetical protein